VVDSGSVLSAGSQVSHPPPPLGFQHDLVSGGWVVLTASQFSEPKCGNRIRKTRKRARNDLLGEHWWLTSIILATQEAEVRRILVQSQPKQIVHKSLSEKIPITK
jgi:hypothetical protein